MSGCWYSARIKMENPQLFVFSFGPNVDCKIRSPFKTGLLSSTFYIMISDAKK